MFIASFILPSFITLYIGYVWLAAVSSNRFEIAEEAGADIGPLTEAGVPGFGLVPEPLHYFDYHHTNADTLDKVDPKELAQDTAAIAALAWILAE